VAPKNTKLGHFWHSCWRAALLIASRKNDTSPAYWTWIILLQIRATIWCYTYFTDWFSGLVTGERRKKMKENLNHWCFEIAGKGA